MQYLLLIGCFQQPLFMLSNSWVSHTEHSIKEGKPFSAVFFFSKELTLYQYSVQAPLPAAGMTVTSGICAGLSTM